MRQNEQTYTTFSSHTRTRVLGCSAGRALFVFHLCGDLTGGVNGAVSCDAAAGGEAGRGLEESLVVEGGRMVLNRWI